MRVLFVASGNSKNFEVAPFIKAQGDSLILEGAEVFYFPIISKGIFGYLRSAVKLKKHLKNMEYDIIHAHYALSGWTAVLSFPRQPIVLSLMGSDAYGEFIDVNRIKFSSKYLILLTKLIQPFIEKIICKSKHIEGYVYMKNKSFVIPNGVLLEKFEEQVDNYRSELNLKPNIKYVLFLGDKKNIRKNYKLAFEAVKKLNNQYVELLVPYPAPHDIVLKYLHSVDCLVVPSLMEGSPNVVKEAMACNCPVVATDVGDVKWLFGNEPGYFLTKFEVEDVAQKIDMALNFILNHGRTNGRERIIKLGLDSRTVAKRIIDVYHQTLEYDK